MLPEKRQRYWLIEKKLDWQSAANFCSHKWNCGLAAITTSDEQVALATYLKKDYCKFVCCGLVTGVLLVQWTGFPSSWRFPAGSHNSFSQRHYSGFYNNVQKAARRCTLSSWLMPRVHGQCRGPGQQKQTQTLLLKHDPSESCFSGVCRSSWFTSLLFGRMNDRYRTLLCRRNYVSS